eukprot:65401-Lingulodinium_polyedra.AAC.1
MKGVPAVPAGGFTINSVRGYFKTMSVDAVRSYAAAGDKPYHLIVGEGCAPFVPPGYLFSERCAADTPNYGARAGVAA